MTTPQEPKLVVTPKQRVAGNSFGREDAIRTLHCISDSASGCEREITEDEYYSWDTETKAEYAQSGWCKECQDKIFCDPECCCTYIDVLGPGYPQMPGPMNEMCPVHGDPDFTDLDLRFDYDPDQREDEPPADMHAIEWTETR